MKCIQRNTSPVQHKLPITLELLQKISKVIGTSYDDQLIWAAMTLGHFGLLRAAEFTVNTQNSFDPLTNLTCHDVHITSQGTGEMFLKLHLKTSKTDRSDQGINIYIGCTHDTVCAVCAMQQFITHYLSKIKRNQDPLFRFSNGLILTRSILIKQTKLLLAGVGVDPEGYTGHSYRVGGATTAAAAGLQDWEIKLMGRWNSDTYQQYIKAPINLITGFAKRMTKPLNNYYNFTSPYIQ
jgi:hypothetical protein